MDSQQSWADISVSTEAHRTIVSEPLIHRRVQLQVVDRDAVIKAALGDTQQDQNPAAKFLHMKDSLNKMKSKLDPLATDERKWRDFQKKTYAYADLTSTLEKAGVRLVTNAWTKFYELFSEYYVDDKSDQNVRIFFNAELPGAGVLATNHFMATRASRTMEWRASSLVGHGALGDYFSLQANYKNNWLMNSWNDGDSTQSMNIDDFVGQLRDPVDIYTHDAGTEDRSKDFNNQELINSKLHFGCALAGFRTLRRGGMFIAKQFTCFENVTLRLMNLYAALFDEFWICKPSCSREANSEMYFVGRGYRGMSAALQQRLTEMLDAWDEDITSHLICEPEFIEQCYEFCLELCKKQECAIEKMVAVWGECVQFDHKPACEDWLQKYPVAELHANRQLLVSRHPPKQLQPQKKYRAAPAPQHLPKRSIQQKRRR